MNPELILAIISLLQVAVKAAPEIASAITTVLSKDDPTEADWLSLKEKILSKKYEDYTTDVPVDPPVQTT